MAPKRTKKKKVLLSKKELASALGMGSETVSKFLRSIGIDHPGALTPKDFQIIKDHCHPLYFKITRETLAKICKIHPQTLTNRLREIGINHRKDFKRDELTRIYIQLPLPKWVFDLGVLADDPDRKNVETFFKRIGVTTKVSLFNFYWGRLNAIAEKKQLSFFELMLMKTQNEFKDLM